MSEPMPTRYHRTARVPIVVHIICERCGHAYTSSQELVAKASIALDPNAAATNARLILAEQLERLRLGDCSALDGAPCPKCGYEQSWMLRTRVRAAQQVGASVGAALIGIPLLGLALTDRLGSSVPLAILIAILGAVVGYLVARPLVAWLYRGRLAAARQYPTRMPTPELASVARRAGRTDSQ